MCVYACSPPPPPAKKKQNWLLKKIVELFCPFPSLFVHFHFIFVDWVWIIEMVRKLFSFQFVFIFSCRKDEENVPKVYFMTWWVRLNNCVCVCRMKVFETQKKKKKSKTFLLGCGKEIVWLKNKNVCLFLEWKRNE